jgi:hypothetical protein
VTTGAPVRNARCIGAGAIDVIRALVVFMPASSGQRKPTEAST